jgi:nitrite reductase/ring-hydroxylating ferredoxin subunit
MRFIGRVRRADLAGQAMVRLDDPPFHVLVTMVDGVPRAIEDACNHAGASLSEGERRGSRVVCPMHGYEFELSNGRLIEPRGACGDQRCFFSYADGDDVLVWDPGPLSLVTPELT